MAYTYKALLSLLFFIIMLWALPVYADDYTDILTLVNTERAHACLAPVSFSWHLSEIAIRHTQDMIDRNYFSHTAPDPAPNGPSPADRVSNGGYAWLWIGENLATGFGSAGEAVAAWMASPGHRANILNPEFVEMGVARIGTTWTQVFGRPVNMGAPAPDCNLYGINATPPPPPAPAEQPPAPVEQPPAPVEQPPAPVEQPPAPVEQPPAPAEQPPAPVVPAVQSLQSASESAQPIVEQPRSVIQLAQQSTAQLIPTSDEDQSDLRPQRLSKLKP